MKLIKIGRDQRNNIVLYGSTVSSFHAEITLLDSGEFLLEDKGSTNGTFVSGVRIAPNQPQKISYGQKISFHNEDLDWSRIPKLPDLSDCKRIINIGSHHLNDEVIPNNNRISRFHAQILIRGNKAFIKDNGSANGTKVNGTKIQSDTEVRIKKGDKIMLDKEDVSAQLKKYIPSTPGWMKWGGIGVGAAALIAILIVLVPKIIDIINPHDDVIDPLQMRPATVYVMSNYHYVVKFEDNPIPKFWNGEIDAANEAGAYFKNRSMSPELAAYVDGMSMRGGQATAFFIDREGHLATNRHVAVPWEYNKDKDFQKVEYLIDEYINNILPQYVTQSNLNYSINLLNSTAIGRAILNSVQEVNDLSVLNKYLRKIRNSKKSMIGKMDFIVVGYPGRNYTHYDEFKRCSVKVESGDPEMDIAILRMNDTKTPEEISHVFDVNNFCTETLTPQHDKLYVIGYPNGIVWAMDESTKSLEPYIKETKCSKIPGKYNFEFDGEAVGGASGSPIFNEKGQLVGVLWGGWSEGNSFGLACQAKWLKKMYDEEVLGK